MTIEEVDPRYAAAAAGAVLAAVVLGLALLAPRPTSKKMSLSVRWRREKLRVQLPSPDSSLGSLRALLAQQTALPPDSFKLVHAGAVMKDDNAPLSAYGLRHGSKLAIIDGAADARTDPAVKENKTKDKPDTEEATIAVIRDELASVEQSLVPALDTFLATISPSPSPTSSAPDPASEDLSASSTTTQPARASAPTRQSSIPPSTGAAPDIEMEHRRLGEELLQALLRLDVLNMDGEWTSARSERKSAVKTVQALLDRLDGGWRARKERLVSQEQE